MPNAAPRPCTYPGCGVLVYGGSRCDKHKVIERKRYDQQRGSSAQRGYGSRWQKARATYLANHPTCVACAARGMLTAASVVDHITPHKGNTELFWSVDNWQAMCKPCHDAKTAREDGGFGKGRAGENLYPPNR